MGRLAILSTIAALMLLPVPAAADAPNVDEFPAEVIWEVENPCSDVYELVRIEVSTVFREHLHSHGRITVGKMTVTGVGDWTGYGIDAGVELEQGENVVHRLILTSTATGEKFRFTIMGHFNANTGEWNVEPVPTTECIKT